MIKCTKGQIRRLKTALRWKIPPEQRQRIQMVLLRESGMTQPLIAAAIRMRGPLPTRTYQVTRLWRVRSRCKYGGRGRGIVVIIG